MTRLFVVLTCATLTVAAVGCENAGDNGRKCELVKRDPNSTDGGRLKVLESEITPGKDFISFSATECEDLVCVREAEATKTGDPNAVALGKCSRPCASPATRCPSAEAGVELACRALILDEATLAAICRNDKTKCDTYFGGATTPYFCAATTDAGT